MKSKLYVRSNGNGDITLSKLAALIGLLLMVLSPIISVSASSAVQKRDIEALNKIVPENKENIEELKESQIEADVRISTMHEDIAEIKQDVKTLLRDS